MIWSDPEIQKVASEYVCVIEETFFLFPPKWLKNPPDPAATKLFQTYAANAPRGTFPKQTSTHQGLYCLTPQGDYLSGKFARQTNEIARETLTAGLQSFGQLAGERGLKPKPVPQAPLALYGGEPLQAGAVKLEVAYRDLPRGDQETTKDWYLENPYNLGWFDLSPEEAKALVVEPGGKHRVPGGLVQKLARTKLKDAVRGQMRDWNENEVRSGQLFSELVSEDGNKRRYQLSGSADMAAAGLTFKPEILGTFVYDTAAGEFTDFRMIAVGQRSGKGGANGRESDLGPAPIGIAFTLYKAG